MEKYLKYDDELGNCKQSEAFLVWLNYCKFYDEICYGDLAVHLNKCGAYKTLNTVNHLCWLQRCDFVFKKFDLM